MSATTHLLPAVVAASAVLSVGLTAPQADAAQYVIGPADALALDQPRITFGLTDESTPAGTLIGPTSPTQALLDTGANGVLLAGLAYASGENYGQPAFAFDYDASGAIDGDELLAQYAELGVAGTSLLDVHDVHGLRIEDSDGIQRLIGTDIRAFGDRNLNIGSYSAIVGMPAMQGYVIEVDLRPMASLAFQEVRFHDNLAQASFESAASMNVDLRMLPPEYTDTTLPANMRPTFAALPIIDHVDMTHTNGANSGGATLTADDYSFLLDTGAQTNIISQQMAIDMGLDFTNTLALGGDVVDFLEVGGIGGTAFMPLVIVDKFVMPTQSGIDLVYTDLLVGVLDIDGAPFDAVFGMNMLTTGYLAAAFGGGVSTGLVDDDVPDKESFDLLVEFEFVQTIDDLFVDLPLQGPVLNITRADYDLLVQSGILPDTDDPTVAFCAALELDGQFDITNNPNDIAFDKVVFDFTATDGTAVMRLDLTSFALTGDTDGDGDVDDSDLGNAFANYTGPVGAAGGKTLADGDTDGDGDVDDSDLGSAFANYTGPFAPASVPEPTSLVLLGLAGLWMGQRRRGCR